MVRLMLTLTPVVCVLSGIAFSCIFEKYMLEDVEQKKAGEGKDLKDGMGGLLAFNFVVELLVGFVLYSRIFC